MRDPAGCGAAAAAGGRLAEGQWDSAAKGKGGRALRQDAAVKGALYMERGRNPLGSRAGEERRVVCSRLFGHPAGGAPCPFANDLWMALHGLKFLQGIFSPVIIIEDLYPQIFVSLLI